MTREKQRVYDQTPGKVYREIGSSNRILNRHNVLKNRSRLSQATTSSISINTQNLIRVEQSEKLPLFLLMNMITNSTQYTLGTMKDNLLLKPDVLLFQNVKSTSPYIPSTNNSAKNKGKEKSSRATYKKYSQKRKQSYKNTFTYDEINLT